MLYDLKKVKSPHKKIVIKKKMTPRILDKNKFMI